MADSKKYNGSTWQHSLRKLTTATDTITTLPANLYADGNNATVGLVGNMSQTGTPTPQNPIQPQECGDLETVGEKAGQYKIPISSANTTTNVYLGEVQSTRKIKKLVLDGTEDWRIFNETNHVFRLVSAFPDSTIGASGLCTHYQCGGSTSMDDGYFYITANRRLYIRDTNYSTETEFKAFLAAQYSNGTPVIVYGILADAETTIVNESIRKIGDYADEVSGITIPTIAGANSFDVLTTLKPSEVSLSYTGWHDATVEEWDGSEWQ